MGCCDALEDANKKIAELEQQVARLSGLANCGTAENFLKCSDEVKREYFAGFIRESSRRKELEQQIKTERLRLAACGSAALGYFDGCRDENADAKS